MGAFVKVIIWSFIYFGIIGRIVLQWLTVSPFRYPYFREQTEQGVQWAWRTPFKDCISLWNQFSAGTWRIDTFVDVGFAALFLSYYPIWLFVIWLLVRSKKVAPKPTPLAPQKKESSTQTWANPTSSRRPRALPQGLYNTAPVPAQNKTENQAPSGSPAQPQMSEGSSMHDNYARGPDSGERRRDLPEKTPVRYQLVRNELNELCKEYDLMIYDSLSFIPNEPPVPFALAMDDCVFLVDVVDDPQAEWIPDDAYSDDEVAYWFSASQQIPSPFQRLVKQAKNLQQADIGSASVVVIVVVASGSVIGADSLMDVWKEQGGMVVRLNRSVRCEELPLLSDYVAETLSAYMPSEGSEGEEGGESGEAEENEETDNLDNDVSGDISGQILEKVAQTVDDTSSKGRKIPEEMEESGEDEAEEVEETEVEEEEKEYMTHGRRDAYKRSIPPTFEDEEEEGSQEGEGEDEEEDFSEEIFEEEQQGEEAPDEVEDQPRLSRQIPEEAQRMPTHIKPSETDRKEGNIGEGSEEETEDEDLIFPPHP